MTFPTGMADIQAAHEAGRYWLSFAHKTTATTPGAAGQWGDLSMGAGTPKYNAYVGAQLEFTQLVNTNNSAFYTGPTPAAGEAKVVESVGFQSTQGTGNVPLTVYWCDYLGFYPLIDGDDNEIQSFANTASLPRYSSGEGVRAFLVTTSPSTTNGTATLIYTDSDGTAGKSVTFGVAASSNLGAIANRQGSTVAANTAGPFIALASGSNGIRSCESIQFPTAIGGFHALVLCRPLFSQMIREASTWTEYDLYRHYGIHLPRLYDGHFVQPIFITSGTGNPATVRARMRVYWG